MIQVSAAVGAPVCMQRGIFSSVVRTGAGTFASRGICLVRVQYHGDHGVKVGIISRLQIWPKCGVSFASWLSCF